MTDDDFESVVRRVFESFMGSLRDFSDNGNSFGYFTGSMFNEPDEMIESQANNEHDIERIDLEDEVLFIMHIQDMTIVPAVRIDGRSLVITSDGNSTSINLDFDVNIKDSRATSRNSILEISLKKEVKKPSTKTSGYLKIE